MRFDEGRIQIKIIDDDMLKELSPDQKMNKLFEEEAIVKQEFVKNMREEKYKFKNWSA